VIPKIVYRGVDSLKGGVGAAVDTPRFVAWGKSWELSPLSSGSADVALRHLKKVESKPKKIRYS